MILLFLMLLSTEVSVESGIIKNDLPHMHPLEASLDKNQVKIAIEIESILIDKGVAPRLARAATVNAIAESNLNPNAVGDKGHSVGVFQLHDRGMGKNMTVESRKDIKTSTSRVAKAVLNDDYLMSLQRKCAPIDDMIRHFTIRIMRPSNKYKKSEQRVNLGKKIIPDALNVQCVMA